MPIKGWHHKKGRIFHLCILPTTEYKGTVLSQTFTLVVGTKVISVGWELWVWDEGMIADPVLCIPDWWNMILCNIKNILLLTLCGHSIEASPRVNKCLWMMGREKLQCYLLHSIEALLIIHGIQNIRNGKKSKLQKQKKKKKRQSWWKWWW